MNAEIIEAIEKILELLTTQLEQIKDKNTAEYAKAFQSLMLMRINLYSLMQYIDIKLTKQKKEDNNG